MGFNLSTVDKRLTVSISSFLHEMPISTHIVIQSQIVLLNSKINVGGPLFIQPEDVRMQRENER